MRTDINERRENEERTRKGRGTAEGKVAQQYRGKKEGERSRDNRKKGHLTDDKINQNDNERFRIAFLITSDNFHRPCRAVS